MLMPMEVVGESEVGVLHNSHSQKPMMTVYSGDKFRHGQYMKTMEVNTKGKPPRSTKIRSSVGEFT